MDADTPIIAKLDRATRRCHHTTTLESLLLSLVCLTGTIWATRVDVVVIFAACVVFDPLDILCGAVLHNAEVVVEKILAATQSSHRLALLSRR